MNEQLMMDLKAFQKEEKRLRKLGIIGTYDSNFFTSPVSADFLVQLKESAFMDSFPKYTFEPWGDEEYSYALLAKQDGIVFFTLVSSLEEIDENREEDADSERIS